MRPEKNDLDRAVALLQAGELVAFPTETVYGLGADAANPAAVARIFAAKRRPADHPLIVHLPADGYLDRWARDIPSVAWELAEAFWPGPLTLILKCAAAVPKVVTGGQDSVGLRVPAHPLALDLLRAYARAGGGLAGMGGIAAPSANRFGRISPTAAEHVREELGDAVPLILDGGRCPVGIESTILDLTPGESLPPRLLRPGRITPNRSRRSSASCRRSSPVRRTAACRGFPVRWPRTTRQRRHCACSHARALLRSSTFCSARVGAAPYSVTVACPPRRQHTPAAACRPIPALTPVRSTPPCVNWTRPTPS
jgi:tRNA threonylcarbamoyl adenosine modification protein (Sua5/YciO/YrdC/YwlC family)